MRLGLILLFAMLLCILPSESLGELVGESTNSLTSPVENTVVSVPNPGGDVVVSTFALVSGEVAKGNLATAAALLPSDAGLGGMGITEGGMNSVQFILADLDYVEAVLEHASGASKTKGNAMNIKGANKNPSRDLSSAGANKAEILEALAQVQDAKALKDLIEEAPSNIQDSTESLQDALRLLLVGWLYGEGRAQEFLSLSSKGSIVAWNMYVDSLTTRLHICLKDPNANKKEIQAIKKFFESNFAARVSHSLKLMSQMILVENKDKS